MGRPDETHKNSPDAAPSKSNRAQQHTKAKKETEAVTPLQTDQTPHLTRDLTDMRQPPFPSEKAAHPVAASPPSYSQKIAEQICERLSRGRTLKAVCASSTNFPEPHIVRQWALADVEGFAEKYARARELGFLHMADELIEIVDQIDGNITRDKLRVDTRKWLLSKAMPKGFGETPEVKAAIKIGLDEGDYETGKRIAFALELSSRAGEDSQ